MASPFCMICQGFGDTEGLLCCEAFPRGIPSAIYPWGCVSRREPSRSAKGMAWFKPKSGMEEVARLWADISK